MSGAFGGRRVLLVDTANERSSSHAPLRRRALERLGCTVRLCDLGEKQGLLGRWRSGSPADRLSRVIEEMVPDVVLVVDAAELTGAMVQQARRESGARWANWFMGGLRSLPLMEAVGGAYDTLFVPGSDCARRLTQPGRPPAHYLPPACDPSVHRPMTARDTYRANVVFVGRATPRREQLLSELVEFGLALWGPDWRKTGLRDYCRGDRLDGADYVRAYAGASVAVNIHDEPQGEGGTSTGCNQRTFELASIGAPQVVDERADLSSHFFAGQELLVYRNAAELKELVQRLLHDRTESERLSQASRRRAMAEHTYMHRMGELLGVVLGRREA